MGQGEGGNGGETRLNKPKKGRVGIEESVMKGKREKQEIRKSKLKKDFLAV